MKNDIFDIIGKKKYSELNAAERNEISDFIGSEEEYLALQKTINASTLLDSETVLPEVSIKRRLLKRFRKSRQQKGKLFEFQSVYLKIAAAVIAGITISFLLWNSFNNSIKKGESAGNYNHKIENNFVLNKNLVLEQEQKNQTSLPSEQKLIAVNKTSSNLSNDSIFNNNYSDNTNVQQKQNIKIGRTLKDDAALAELLFVAL